MFLKNTFFYLAGIVFLALAKVKHILKGYSTPKPFDISNTDKCIDYDIHVVESWLAHLQKYTESKNFLKDKTVLELGPGSDLGVGLYLLSKGCFQYNAVDVNDLTTSTPHSFYEQMFKRLKEIDDQADIDFLKEQLKKATTRNKAQLNYMVHDDFSILSAFGEDKIDLVFSQAAFEHFDDIDATISQLSAVCKPGAVIVSEIDLKTHSRWIRDKDPNNIYRYPNYVYSKFWFRGVPNRVRPFQYIEAFKRNGWIDISITPLLKLNENDGSHVGMNKAFANEKNQMGYLTIMLCARKST